MNNFELLKTKVCDAFQSFTDPFNWIFRLQSEFPPPNEIDSTDRRSCEKEKMIENQTKN